MCLATHLDIIESLKLIVGHRDIYNAKIFEILSYVWRLEFLYKRAMYMKVTLFGGHYYKHADWIRHPSV